MALGVLIGTGMVLGVLGILMTIAGMGMASGPAADGGGPRRGAVPLLAAGLLLVLSGSGLVVVSAIVAGVS